MKIERPPLWVMRAVLTCAAVSGSTPISGLCQ
jgi:hypothetical protein